MRINYYYHKLEGYDAVCQDTINVGKQPIDLFVDFPSHVNNDFKINK
jgi:hypothetical protein